jgi:nitrite reductase (NADH) small subunit
MSAQQFVTVARVGEIPAGGARLVRVGVREIALFFSEGRYYALDDCCPHAGASLHTGDLADGLVICDRHLWAFRLADGRSPDSTTLRAETYDVRVAGEEIQIRVPD